MEKSIPYEDKYVVKEKLGEGGNGVVYKAIQKSNNKEVAIKKFDKKKIKDSFMSENLRQITKEEMKPYIDSFLKETENMKIAEGIDEDNENSIKFIEYYDLEDDFVIVMELCDENLTTFIAKKNEKLSDEEIYMILSQLNNTFRIISSKKIAHRDLKLENILVKYENKEKTKFTFKLTDYGESKTLSVTNKYTQVGTCNFTAPEILNGDGYNIECDLWSLGIIIHVLCFKTYPYKGDTFGAVHNQIKGLGKRAIKKTNNPKIDDLIARLLINDKKERMTWNQYFKHPFFVDRDIRNYYDIDFKNKIGGGGFGEVYSAKLKRNNKKRAIKIISIKKIKDEALNKKLKKLNEEDMKPYIEGFYNEIDNMQLMEGQKDNENTVKFYEFFHTQNEFAIVMELCDDNLLHYFSEKEKSFDINEILDILTQLNKSFKVMVKHKLVHRDLKLENILVKKSDKGKIIYKLTDYGISKQLLSLTKLATKAGSLKFMAPEVEKEDKYNQECDLWSLGVIIHVLFFRDYPKVEDNKVNIKSTGNSDLDNLLKNLLVVNPQNRLTWDNYFNHSFFKNNIKSQIKEEKPNQIIIKLKVKKMDLIKNKDIYFLECNYFYQNNEKKNFEEENKELKELNDENTKIYLDDKPINFCKFFKPTKEGEYTIKIIFKNKILEDCSYLFRYCENIKSIDLSSFDSSKVNNMNYMFGKCFNLEEINLNNFNTEKVTNMSYCFNKCKLLKKIVFPSSFNTKNVQNMEFMFHFCENLIELNFPNNFIVDNVLKMRAMFGKCKCLEKLDLRNFNTSKAKDMSYMFDQCFKLKEILIDQKTFITKNVTSMGHMFNKCYNLKDINLSHFEIPNVNLLSFMFGECDNLTNLNLSNFKNNNNGKIDMSHMFDKCKNLKILDISSINIENKDNINTSEMFNDLSNIEKIIVNKNLVNKYKELFKDLEPKFLTN